VLGSAPSLRISAESYRAECPAWSLSNFQRIRKEIYCISSLRDHINDYSVTREFGSASMQSKWKRFSYLSLKRFGLPLLFLPSTIMQFSSLYPNNDTLGQASHLLLNITVLHLFHHWFKNLVITSVPWITSASCRVGVEVWGLSFSESTRSLAQSDAHGCVVCNLSSYLRWSRCELR